MSNKETNKTVTQETKSVATTTYIERPTDLTKAESIKETLAQLNSAKVDNYGNYHINVKLGEGLILNSVSVRPYNPRETKSNGNTKILAYVTLRFGADGVFATDGWKLCEYISGDKAGQRFFLPPAWKDSKNAMHNLNSFFEAGMSSFIASLVNKIYEARIKEVNTLTTKAL